LCKGKALPYHEDMHTFRYNPAAKRWVLLGEPLPHQLAVGEAHRLEGKRRDLFFAATYPQSPFDLEPGEHIGAPAGGLLYAERPPVGEYEVLLYAGSEPVMIWREGEWEAWARLVQERLLQLYRNPHLHYVDVVLRTATQGTAEPYLRAGDLVATSHPLAGHQDELTAELAEKLAEREQAFIVHADAHGTLLAASAPTLPDELWYLPRTAHPGFERATAAQCRALAEVLAGILPRLRAAAEAHFTVRLHTSLAPHSDLTWWIQIYRDVPMHAADPLPLQRLPELLVKELRETL